MPLPAQPPLGVVASLWRYPVKSMQGEELNSVDITDRGVLGDRALALVEQAGGKIVSAKNPRRWPRMFEFRARFGSPPHNAPGPVAHSAPDTVTGARRAPPGSGLLPPAWPDAGAAGARRPAFP